MRGFSKWPVGKNSSARDSNAVTIYYLLIGNNTAGTSVWNTSPNGYEYTYAQRGRGGAERTTSPAERVPK